MSFSDKLVVSLAVVLTAFNWSLDAIVAPRWFGKVFHGGAAIGMALALISVWS